VVSSRRRRGRWGAIVFGLIASVAIIAFGAYFMWVQHSGVPARVTVQQCEGRGTRFSDQVFGYAFGDSCTGSQGSQDRFLEFWGVYRKDVGHDIDVHISRGSGVFDEAVPDTWIVPPIAVGVGSVLGIATVIGIVRRLRPAPRAAEWTGQPWPGATS
jgi:hypothetical protein